MNPNLGALESLGIQPSCGAWSGSCLLFRFQHASQLQHCTLGATAVSNGFEGLHTQFCSVAVLSVRYDKWNGFVNCCLHKGVLCSDEIYVAFEIHWHLYQTVPVSHGLIPWTRDQWSHKYNLISGISAGGPWQNSQCLLIPKYIPLCLVGKHPSARAPSAEELAQCRAYTGLPVLVCTVLTWHVEPLVLSQKHFPNYTSRGAAHSCSATNEGPMIH